MFPWASRAMTSTPYCRGNRERVSVRGDLRAGRGRSHHQLRHVDCAAMETPGTERNRKPNVHMLFTSGSVSALSGEAPHPLFISHKQGKEALTLLFVLSFQMYIHGQGQKNVSGIRVLVKTEI